MERLRITRCRLRSTPAGFGPTGSLGVGVDFRAVLTLVSMLPFLIAATCSAREQEPSANEVEIRAADCLHLQERLRDKSSLNPAQRKISSDLLLSVWAEQCKSAGHEVPPMRTSVKVDEEGITVVDINAEVTEKLLGRIEELGGTVVSSFPERMAVRAGVPIQRLEELAGSPDLRSIRSADEYQLHKPNLSEDEKGEAP